MNEFRKVRNGKFALKQEAFKEQVKSIDDRLFKALDVTLERTANTELIPNWEVIAASMPGVMKLRSHVGYAETEKIDDMHEAFTQVVNTAAYIIASTDGWVYPDMLHYNNHEVKQALERNEKNNLTQVGRYLARFNYLIGNNK